MRPAAIPHAPLGPYPRRLFALLALATFFEGFDTRLTALVLPQLGVEFDVGPEALFDSAEVFLTGTTANVLPVVEVDRRPIGAGSVGPVCAALRNRFHEVTHGLDPAFAHWLSYAREL